jgi:Flp pilus assembly protein TadG
MTVRSSAVRVVDEGTAIVELTALMIVFFGFVAAIVLAGRVTVGSAHVEAAARTSARTVSLARDPAAAGPEAAAQASAIVNEGSAICQSMDFPDPVIDTSADPATVTVEVTCVVDLSEISVIPVPGTMTVSASAVEVIDRYREEAP